MIALSNYFYWLIVSPHGAHRPPLSDPRTVPGSQIFVNEWFPIFLMVLRTAPL